MFYKFAIVISAIATIAFAAPWPQVASQCNTGNIQCCNQVGDAKSQFIQTALGNLAGVDVGSVTGMIGLQCNPITVIGGTLGPNCAQQPVCCQGNQFNGLVNVGCTPISL